MNKYIEYNKRVEKAINDFPIIFAFSKEQLSQGMIKFKVNSLEDLCSIGAGGFIRKSDKEEYRRIFKDGLYKELEENIANDDEFVLDMFKYEMGNHEYCLTYDDEEVINACGIGMTEFTKDERLNRLYSEARRKYLDNVEF